MTRGECDNVPGEDGLANLVRFGTSIPVFKRRRKDISETEFALRVGRGLG
jgi:hypothetical protein